MKKILLFLTLLIAQPAYADTILNLSGFNNVANFSQFGNSTIVFTAVNSTNNSNNYDIAQLGGGNHYLNVELTGEFKNYELNIFQNSSSNLSMSITQTCTTSSCTPAPYSFTQY